MQYTPEQAIQSDLKRNHHVEEKITKANQMLVMIWNVRVVSKITRELTYNTFVRPQYGSVVRSPRQSYLENALEKVQRQAARHVCNKYGIISVTNLINDLKWDTLNVRIKLMYNVQNSSWTFQYSTEWIYITIYNNAYQK